MTEHLKHKKQIIKRPPTLQVSFWIWTETTEKSNKSGSPETTKQILIY